MGGRVETDGIFICPTREEVYQEAARLCGAKVDIRGDAKNPQYKYTMTEVKIVGAKGQIQKFWRTLDEVDRVEKQTIPKEAREEFTCDFAESVVPALKHLDRKSVSTVSEVEDNVVTVRAPLGLMNKVFLAVEKRLAKEGEKKAPILL